MRKPKVIIMDLGDTIIHNDSFDFIKGLKYLHQNVLSENTKWEDVLFWNNLLQSKTYCLREQTHLEIRLFDYINILQQVFGFRNLTSVATAELVFFEATTIDSLEPNVTIFLEHCYQAKIPVYILSNSTFSEEVLWHQLNKYCLAQYIKKVFSSANYLVRKPDNTFFELAIACIIREEEIERRDIWYIGNSQTVDILGARRVGLLAIWYSRDYKSLSLPIHENIITSYDQLLLWFQQ